MCRCSVCASVRAVGSLWCGSTRQLGALPSHLPQNAKAMTVRAGARVGLRNCFAARSSCVSTLTQRRHDRRCSRPTSPTKRGGMSTKTVRRRSAVAPPIWCVCSRSNRHRHSGTHSEEPKRLVGQLCDCQVSGLASRVCRATRVLRRSSSTRKNAALRKCARALVFRWFGRQRSPL